MENTQQATVKKLDTWNKAQSWEAGWWGDCINTLNEEQKQLTYAEKMGLQWVRDPKTPYNLEIQGRSVLDVGGGPVSLLLKATGFSVAVVADPLMDAYPDWVRARYKEHHIASLSYPGEKLGREMDQQLFDEVWCYNVLQHVSNPALVVKNMIKLGRLIRIFEWIDTPTNVGHPHSLKAHELDSWLNGEGKVEQLQQPGLYGKAYFGVFPTPNWQ